MQQWRKVFLSVCLLVVALHLNALSLKEGYPQTYTVNAKDTLWGIASHYLHDPWKWPVLWRCNPQVHNPHLIYPGDTLRVTVVGGQPCLQVAPRVVKLSPNMRIEKSQSPIPPISLSLIEPFLTQSQVMPLKQFLAAPYIIAHQGQHLISTRGNTVFARGLKNNRRTRFLVLHRDENYTDPISKKNLGIAARYVATVELENVADPASLNVLAARGVINEGDRLFAVNDEQQLSQFIPRMPRQVVNTQIIAVLRNISQVGRFSIVALNYGKNVGARPGQVLTIFRRGKVIRDKYTKGDDNTVHLPNKKIGLLMVFKTFDNVSYALVMQASQAVRILDKVRSEPFSPALTSTSALNLS